MLRLGYLLSEKELRTLKLSRFFLEKAAKELNIPSKRFSDKALDKLRVSVWPGNVRQLQNICKRLTALVPTLIIDFDDLPDEILNDLPEDKSDLTTWETGLEQWAMDRCLLVKTIF